MVCSVLMCKNRTCANRKQGVSFHKFPLRNPRLLSVWLNNISRPGDWQPSTRSRICSDHFKPESLVKNDDRVELAKDAVPSMHISFRAKGAPKISEIFEEQSVLDEVLDQGSPLTADHSYSSGDQEPPKPSVEVAMKEHSYFTGVAPHCVPSQIDQTPPQEALEAPEDHTYHSNLPTVQGSSKPSLDDHTYNRDNENIRQLMAQPGSTDLIHKLPEEVKDVEDAGALRNFDHTYNHKTNIEGPSAPDCDNCPSSNHSPKKGQKRALADQQLLKDLLEENDQLRQKVSHSELRATELGVKLEEALQRNRKLQGHVNRLKKTLAEVVLESVEKIDGTAAKKMKT